MKRDGMKVCVAALMGAAAAVIGRGITVTWDGLLDPFRLLGTGLRSLSLSGFFGNLAAWCVVLLLSALPLSVLLRRRSKGWENVFPAAASAVIFVGVYVAVNPSRLNTPLRDVFPLFAVQTALSLLLVWWVLRWLKGLRGMTGERLTVTFRRLFRLCGLLLAGAGAFGQMAALLKDWQGVKAGNTGSVSSLGLTLGVMILLCVLRLMPDLLAGMTLMRGGELARTLERGVFDEEGVVLCGETAAFCSFTAQATVVIAAVVNLLQLLLFEKLHDSDYTLELPLLTLALAAGLFLLCRILERGRELQEDSDSII